MHHVDQLIDPQHDAQQHTHCPYTLYYSECYTKDTHHATQSRACEVASSLHVARVTRTTGNVDVVEGEIRAATITAEDVVVLCARGRSSGDVSHRDVGNDDAVGWSASWATVKVVLLDIDSVNGGVLDVNVLVGDTVSLVSRRSKRHGDNGY